MSYICLKLALHYLSMPSKLKLRITYKFFLIKRVCSVNNYILNLSYSKFTSKYLPNELFKPTFTNFLTLSEESVG